MLKTIKLFLVSFLVVCVWTTGAVASGESDQAKIQRAMKAAPSSISAEATIMDRVDGVISVLRDGSNGWTCFPGVPLYDGDKHPMCNDHVWMEWMAAYLDGSLFRDETDPLSWRPSTIGYSYMLRGDALVNNDDPFRGPLGEWDQEGPHLMLLYPPSVPLPLVASPNDGGPYVMWNGTPVVHVMVPLTDRDR